MDLYQEKLKWKKKVETVDEKGNEMNPEVECQVGFQKEEREIDINMHVCVHAEMDRNISNRFSYVLYNPTPAYTYTIRFHSLSREIYLLCWILPVNNALLPDHPIKKHIYKHTKSFSESVHTYKHANSVVHFNINLFPLEHAYPMLSELIHAMQQK